MRNAWLILLGLLTTPALAAAPLTYSDADLARIASNKLDSGNLPLGDQHYSLQGPRMGYIYLCHLMPQGGGADRDGSWIHGDTWNIHEKISVQGNVKWPNATFAQQLGADGRTITGNGLPTNHGTGIFPIQQSDPAYRLDRNPNSIEAQSIFEKLPANPVYGESPHCMGMEVGYMLNGVPLFNGFDAEMRDAAAHEVQDACQGHPQQHGTYHYHSLSSCIGSASIKTVIGYALDGFPITGPQVAPGKYLTTNDLDMCHGISSEFTEDGVSKTGYHYVMTADFPYSVSCFRGVPVRSGPLHPPQSDTPMQGQTPQQGQRRGPPQEAINACNNVSESAACNFISPRGDAIQGSCHMTPGNISACVPDRR